VKVLKTRRHGGFFIAVFGVNASFGLSLWQGLA
jgi:hypothetical protein